MRSREEILQDIQRLSRKSYINTLTGTVSVSHDDSAISVVTLIEVMLDIRDQQTELLRFLRDERMK